jgi:hypothetical protein
VWIGPAEIGELREQTRYKIKPTAHRTSAKGLIHEGLSTVIGSGPQAATSGHRLDAR